MMNVFRDLLLLAILLSTVAGCSPVRPVGEAPNLLRTVSAPDEINWPEDYRPERATFFVHNEIDISAPPEKVWEILTKAVQWPSWYPGAFDVTVIDSSDGRLRPDSAFSWNTMGFDFTSAIREFQPPYRLAWESRRRIIQGYHTWLIVPTPTGSRIITEESQYGLLAQLQPIVVPNKLRDLHDLWLRNLKIQVESENKNKGHGLTHEPSP